MPLAIIYETYQTPIKAHKLKFAPNFEAFKEKVKIECELDDIDNYIFIEKSIGREIEDQEDYNLMLKDLNDRKKIEINIVSKNK